VTIGAIRLERRLRDASSFSDKPQILPTTTVRACLPTPFSKVVREIARILKVPFLPVLPILAILPAKMTAVNKKLARIFGIFA
jgi:hypothetical protein